MTQIGTSKLASVQGLILTAMTLLGFYFCFREIKRLTAEMICLRGEVKNRLTDSTGSKKCTEENDGQPAAGDECPEEEIAKETEIPAADENAVEIEEVLLGSEMFPGHDMGIEDMLDILNSLPTGMQMPPETETAPPEELTRESLMAKTRAELEGMAHEFGCPIKKTATKSQIVDAILNTETSVETPGASLTETPAPADPPVAPPATPPPSLATEDQTTEAFITEPVFSMDAAVKEEVVV